MAVDAGAVAITLGFLFTDAVLAGAAGFLGVVLTFGFTGVVIVGVVGAAFAVVRLVITMGFLGALRICTRGFVSGFVTGEVVTTIGCAPPLVPIVARC